MFDPVADKLLVMIYAGSLVYVNLIPGTYVRDNILL